MQTSKLGTLPVYLDASSGQDIGRSPPYCWLGNRAGTGLPERQPNHPGWGVRIEPGYLIIAQQLQGDNSRLSTGLAASRDDGKRSYNWLQREKIYRNWNWSNPVKARVRRNDRKTLTLVSKKHLSRYCLLKASALGATTVGYRNTSHTRFGIASD